MNKSTTIFRQLIQNIGIPVFIALLLLFVLNYYLTKNLIDQSNKNKSQVVTDEVTHILEIEDVLLQSFENGMETHLRECSNRLVYDYFNNTSNIETANLDLILVQLNMNPNLEAIYIISGNGVIVNTTFKKDLNLNLFSFGEDHKQYLLKILQSNYFVNERFAIENATKSLKKYTYQATRDKKYIIELGAYSPDASTILKIIQSSLNDITKKHNNMGSVELFIAADHPFSLNNVKITDDESHIIKKVANRMRDTSYYTIDSIDRKIEYEYLFLQRKKTSLYKGSIIRIISDRSADGIMLRRELIKSIIIFGITIFAVILLIYRKTKGITKPVENLVNNINTITNDGDLSARAVVTGRNEVARLSMHFNEMLEKIELNYNELERRVQQRTAQINLQKEELQVQRDDLAQKNSSLEKAYLEIEKQQTHITDSIHYAKRLQVAVLPPERLLRDCFSEYFLLNKPKDIVSGDFYWIAQKDGLIFIAVADCTGHGVPGAFMSIIGNSMLNNAVKLRNAVKPAEVLNIVNQGVSDLLSQTDEKAKVKIKDGMDIALCVIDLDKMILEYAGAFNPLIILRKDKLIEIKGDNLPIGAFWGSAVKDFTNHTIELQKGDCIYLFSDGYLDQFGEKDERKFMIKRFRVLLQEIFELPMNEQKEILNDIFMQWKGKIIQIDDVTVLGVRI